MNIKALFKRYKDIIPYGFFGVCTTLVNMGVYWLCAYPFKLAVIPSTLIAWFIAVLFAYLTNRKWVFHSEAKTRQEIWKEIVSFYSCRIATGVVDWACMFVFVDLLHLNDMAIKVIANILVIILNYVASKLVIFKKK
ncbi:MAG: GtrA family protein [Clostridia bacterium]|nr:GtrA family protein [Clostridia bacterium]MBP3652834.1 GtrA family protein [Clostridia bacterium]